jgi:MerR family transcriptional regulator/heat shock protein HspR
VILNLTRDLGVNLAGVEIILNMRTKMEAMEDEIRAFMDYVQGEFGEQFGRVPSAKENALVRRAPPSIIRFNR